MQYTQGLPLSHDRILKYHIVACGLPRARTVGTGNGSQVPSKYHPSASVLALPRVHSQHPESIAVQAR